MVVSNAGAAATFHNTAPAHVATTACGSVMRHPMHRPLRPPAQSTPNNVRVSFSSTPATSQAQTTCEQLIVEDGVEIPCVRRIINSRSVVFLPKQAIDQRLLHKFPPVLPPIIAQRPPLVCETATLDEVRELQQVMTIERPHDCQLVEYFPFMQWYDILKKHVKPRPTAAPTPRPRMPASQQTYRGSYPTARSVRPPAPRSAAVHSNLPSSAPRHQHSLVQRQQFPRARTTSQQNRHLSAGSARPRLPQTAVRPMSKPSPSPPPARPTRPMSPIVPQTPPSSSHSSPVIQQTRPSSLTRPSVTSTTPSQASKPQSPACTPPPASKLLRRSDITHLGWCLRWCR